MQEKPKEKKRILWLLNHTTLRNFEVPMLIDMGYEIYCPKVYQYEYGDLSASVTYEYDSSLTIEPALLEQMNQIDFYKNIPYELKQELNDAFDFVFFGAFVEQISYLVDFFTGIFIFQAFGLEETMNYTKVFLHSTGLGMLSRIEKLGDRFFFAQAYENLSKVEYPFFQSRCVNLPIGLRNATVNHSWVGGDHRILFISPKINSNAYYYNIYATFVKNFQEFEYLIGGSQLIPVKNDKRVLGFVPKEQYDYNMTRLDLMFYHSQEPRHLHYHPLEAIKNGMPLLFMGGGMLDRLGGNNLPGRCESIKEAHQKARRIMAGDRKLINEIVATQPILLEPFTERYCKKRLEQVLQKANQVMVKVPSSMIVIKKKIAIILPAEYTGGVLDYTIRFLKALKICSVDTNNIELVFVHLEHDNYKNKNCFTQIEKMGISIRSFRWSIVSAVEVLQYYKLRGIDFPIQFNEYAVLEDGIDRLGDCDYWIFMSDMVPAPVFATKPYAVVAHDYIQRYFPELYGQTVELSRLMLQRQADWVLTTTPCTRKDAINYACIREEKVVLTPMLFEQIPLPEETHNTKQENDYMIWPTNTSGHKNHLIALQALEEYYQNGGTIKCYVTGANTEQFDPLLGKDREEAFTEYVQKVRAIIKRIRLLKRNLMFLGNLPKKSYLSLLQNAKFLIHPGYADNGNGAIFDGAYLGVPSLSSNYAAMRYMNQLMQLNVQFFPHGDSSALADLMLSMERNIMNLQKRVPSREELLRFTIESTAQELVRTLRNTIGL